MLADSFRMVRRLAGTAAAVFVLHGVPTFGFSSGVDEVEVNVATRGVPWLEDFEIEDFECRRPLQKPVTAWPALRRLFEQVAELTLDPQTLKPVIEDASTASRRKAIQMDILQRAAVVLVRFQEALMECPLGTVAAALFVNMLSRLPPDEISDQTVSQPIELVLADTRRRDFLERITLDFKLLLNIAPLHVTAASGWSIFAFLNFYERWVEPLGRVDEVTLCAGSVVAGVSAEDMRETIRRYVPYASGRELLGLKFLRGLDPLVSQVLKDPAEFSQQWINSCPAGSAAFSVAASMLALMSNPSLFERFSSMTHHILLQSTQDVLSGSVAWNLFFSLTKLSKFATRAFDLVWSSQELIQLPEKASDFDRIRVDANLRASRLTAAATRHAHAPTRNLAAFLNKLNLSPNGKAHIVYLSAVGGSPFSDHIEAFIRRTIDVRLPGLVLLCMDSLALHGCEETARKLKTDQVLCTPAIDGHVVLVKHAFIPAILSAGVDVVWVDFDTFILRDPTDAIIEARDNPERVLPQKSRIRFGSFLFDEAEDLCHVTKICDKRQHWPWNLSSTFGLDGDGLPNGLVSTEGEGVEMLVTEHWDARCLNNGLFYVRATHRPLAFFVLFVQQLYVNPYTDNQNLFDAFLAHSSHDTAAVETRPILRYALLDIVKQFGCAEGHQATLGSLMTFHFWSSDFHTRESAENEVQKVADKTSNGIKSTIRTRNGVERVAVEKVTKTGLFEMFFSNTSHADDSHEAREFGGAVPFPPAAARFIERVRAPLPNWKGVCAVTAVGIEELVDERMLQRESPLVDWQRAAQVRDDLDPRVAAGAESLLRETVQSPALPPGGAISGPHCIGVPMQAWADALRVVGDLESGLLLTAVEADLLKTQLRRLDIGYLITIQAFVGQGPERLAQELKQAVVKDGGAGIRCPAR